VIAAAGDVPGFADDDPVPGTARDFLFPLYDAAYRRKSESVHVTVP